MSSPFSSKESGEGPNSKHDGNLRDVLMSQDVAKALQMVFESCDAKIQKKSDLNDEDLIKLLASSDSYPAYRTAGSLLRQLSTGSADGGRKQPTDAFSSKDSILSAFASGDLSLLMQLATSSKTEPTRKRTLAEAFTSKDMLAESIADVYTSKEWMGEYQGHHVDIEYAPRALFKDAKKSEQRSSAASTSSSSQGVIKEVLEAPKPNWLSGYYQDLAAEEKSNEPATKKAKSQPKPTTKNPSKKTTKKTSLSSRHSRLEPETKVLVEFTDKDVLFGRGGKSNNHPGNKQYREKLEQLKPIYRVSDKNDKTDLAQALVDEMKALGARFLQRDDEGNYYEVTNTVARRKASQALREDNTPESRMAKRAKYTNR